MESRDSLRSVREGLIPIRGLAVLHEIVMCVPVDLVENHEGAIASCRSEMDAFVALAVDDCHDGERLEFVEGDQPRVRLRGFGMIVSGDLARMTLKWLMSAAVRGSLLATAASVALPAELSRRKA